MDIGWVFWISAGGFRGGLPGRAGHSGGSAGRICAPPAAIAVSTVMGRAMRDGRWWYYLDDGMYGSYSGQMYDHAKYPVEALAAPGETYPSVLAGPTCDSIDIISEAVDLPMLTVGD